MIKPGWQTTEFWVTVLLNVGVVATALQGSLAPKWGAICSTITVAVYALARALTKTGATAPALPLVVTVPTAAVPVAPGPPAAV